MATFYIKQNDTSPYMSATLKDGNDVVIDLTSANVFLHMRPIGSSEVTVNAEAVVTSATEGKVRYDWQDGDTAKSGSYQAEFQINFNNGTIETVPNSGYFIVQILPEIA